MPDAEQRLAALLQLLTQSQTQRARAEAALDALKTRLTEAVDALVRLGVTAETSAARLAELDTEIATQLASAEAALGRVVQ